MIPRICIKGHSTIRYMPLPVDSADHIPAYAFLRVTMKPPHLLLTATLLIKTVQGIPQGLFSIVIGEPSNSLPSGIVIPTGLSTTTPTNSFSLPSGFTIPTNLPTTTPKTSSATTTSSTSTSHTTSASSKTTSLSSSTSKTSSSTPSTTCKLLLVLCLSISLTVHL